MALDMNNPLIYFIIIIILSVAGFFLRRIFEKNEKVKSLRRDQDTIYRWLMNEFRTKNFQFRSTKAISSGTHLSEERVKEVAILDSRIRKSTGQNDGMWTVKAKPLIVSTSKDVPNATFKLSKKTEQGIIKGGEVNLAKSPFNSSINSEILGYESGVFSIWAYVADVHNKVYNEQLNMYIVGYATNNGQDLLNPKMARYPNAWAIGRVAPTKEHPLGTWRFYCNNSDKSYTQLNFTNLLSNGWHLFSVAWSKEKNYIKFIIDKSEVVQNVFTNWPSDFSHSIQIGTWPGRDPNFYFNSKIGTWQFVPSPYEFSLIEKFSEQKLQ
jgi:hypothetical protein